MSQYALAPLSQIVHVFVLKKNCIQLCTGEKNASNKFLIPQLHIDLVQYVVLSVPVMVVSINCGIKNWFDAFFSCGGCGALTHLHHPCWCNNSVNLWESSRPDRAPALPSATICMVWLILRMAVVNDEGNWDLKLPALSLIGLNCVLWSYWVDCKWSVGINKIIHKLCSSNTIKEIPLIVLAVSRACQFKLCTDAFVPSLLPVFWSSIFHSYTLL